MPEKYQYYRGVKFTRDEKTGYYLNSTLKIRMHRFVWVCERGDIPKGYDIHHIDHDRSNNDISNLQLLTKSEHRKIHYEELSDERKQAVIDNMNNNARPKAIEWHKSEEGRKWHREMVKKAYAEGKIGKKAVFTCEVCGKEFEVVPKKGHKFCSGKCHQKYLRDNQPIVTRVCIICGKEYKCKQNSTSKTCSKHCSNIMWHRRKKNGNELF